MEILIKLLTCQILEMKVQYVYISSKHKNMNKNFIILLYFYQNFDHIL